MSKFTPFPALYKKHILLVEDQWDNRRHLAHVLQSWGVRVSFAANGHECLEKVENESFDAILMSVQLPYLDGRQTMLHLRNHGFKQPIVGLDGEFNLFPVANLGGFTDRLPKPADLDILGESLSRALLENLEGEDDE